MIRNLFDKAVLSLLARRGYKIVDAKENIEIDYGQRRKAIVENEHILREMDYMDAKSSALLTHVP